MATQLIDHYNANADATGHAADCRTRVVPTIMGDHRTFDTERCERCVVVLSLLDAARVARAAR